MKYKTLTEFTAAVNKLDKSDTDKINADPTRLFGASHFTYTERMLEMDFNDKLTPRQALTRMRREVEAEARAEARAS